MTCSAAVQRNHTRANAPITVPLTVQGPAGPVFNGNISTTGHDVTTASGCTPQMRRH